jgi:transcription factor C subunit 7
LPVGASVDAIYCSPYCEFDCFGRFSTLISLNSDRCLQTVNPVAKALDLPILVEHGLTEWYSPVKAGTGLHPGPVPANKLVSSFERIDHSYNPTFLVTRKGESVQELYKRGEDFLNAFIQRVEASSEMHERILLCTHAATAIALSQALLGDKSVGRTLRVGCCTLSTFDRVLVAEDGALLGRGVWQARGALARADFLTNGVERDWGMTDIEIQNGVVVEDDGVPGTEGEEDVAFGVQPWDVEGHPVSRM